MLKKLGTLDRLARLHKGEPLEQLLEEANAARAAMPKPSPKTRRPAPAAKPLFDSAAE